MSGPFITTRETSVLSAWWYAVVIVALLAGAGISGIRVKDEIDQFDSRVHEVVSGESFTLEGGRRADIYYGAASGVSIDNLQVPANTDQQITVTRSDGTPVELDSANARITWDFGGVGGIRSTSFDVPEDETFTVTMQGPLPSQFTQVYVVQIPILSVIWNIIYPVLFGSIVALIVGLTVGIIRARQKRAIRRAAIAQQQVSFGADGTTHTY